MLVTWVALIGLAAKTIGTIILHKTSKRDLNMKSTYLHFLGDALSSVAVIISGLLICFIKVYWLDPVLTALINLYILKEAYEVIKETINIMLEGTPKNIDVVKIKENLEQINLVKNIYHIHIWSLNGNVNFIEMHIELEKQRIF